MRLGVAVLVLGALPLGVLACADGTSPLDVNRLNIAVAPLSLPGVGRVCYDLRVTNAAGGAGQVVWSRGTPGLNGGAGDSAAVCSDRFGSGAGGDVTFVGTCDADGPGGARVNSVTLWLDGLYDEVLAYLAPSGDAGWQNPCPAPGGCTLDVMCRANADTPVQFDLTILRQADQGFFDVAVSFEDVFCSAKLDCGESLLFHPVTAARIPTAVVALACTAGADAPDTVLLRDPIEVTCGADTLVIDPAERQGNLYGVGSPDPDPDDAVDQVAVYAGAEALLCAGQPCRKVYWNVALGLDPTVGGCRLSTMATAGTAASFTDGETPANATWPTITWDHALTGPTGGLACSSHPLNGAPTGVSTGYTDVGTPHTFAASYDGDTLSTFQRTPAFVTDGLLLYLDAAVPASYPGAGAAWSDLSGLSNHATLVNGPPFSTEGGGALVFDGLSRHAEAGVIEPSVFSLSMWFKATGVPTNNDNFGATLLVNSPQLYLGTVQYALSYSWANQRLAFTVHGNTVAVATPDGSIARNTLHHVVATYDGAMRRLYVNGELAAESAWTTSPIYPTSGNRKLQIGHWGYPGFTRYFNGLIHQVAIYGRALTASEVRQNYDAHRGRFGL